MDEKKERISLETELYVSKELKEIRKDWNWKNLSNKQSTPKSAWKEIYELLHIVIIIA